MKNLMTSIALGIALSAFNVQAAETDMVNTSGKAEQMSVAAATPELMQATKANSQKGEDSVVTKSDAEGKQKEAKEYETPLSDYSNGGYF